MNMLQPTRNDVTDEPDDFYIETLDGRISTIVNVDDITPEDA